MFEMRRNDQFRLSGTFEIVGCLTRTVSAIICWSIDRHQFPSLGSEIIERRLFHLRLTLNVIRKDAFILPEYLWRGLSSSRPGADHEGDHDYRDHIPPGSIPHSNTLLSLFRKHNGTAHDSIAGW